MEKLMRSGLRAFVITNVLIAVPAFSQPASTRPQPTTTQAASQDTTITTGTVVSSSSTTMVVRTESGVHKLFVFNRDTNKPSKVAEGTKVRIVSRRDGEGIEVASRVELTTAEERAAAASAEPVPPEVRRLERQIERQVRRFRAGVRAGAGLDPEILTAGVHATLGPFFHPDVWFRPNAEFGFGEVTTLFALNFEAIYRLPVTERQSRWTVYVGGGPGLNFIDRDFEAAESGQRDVNFDDFDFDGSLNLLAGLESRSGMFLELKTAAFSRPHVRLLIGYSF